MNSTRSFLFISIFVFTANSYAQQNYTEVNAQIDITASVIQSIELITVNSMNFGNAQPGQVELFINPANDVNAGYMIAIGTPGAEFRLDYVEQIRLTQVDGPGFLTFTYELSANDLEEQSTSEIIEFENRNFRFNNEGRYYIWLGGRVNLENALPGNYEGDFTIEIDYI